VSFVWGLLPWWSWIAVIVGIAACTALGLWPVVFGLAKLIPLPVWGIAFVAVAAVMLLRGHDENLTESVTTSVTKERDAYWRGREDKANKAAQVRELALQLKLDTALSVAQAASDAQAQQIALERAKRQAAEKALKEERNRNVTAHADAVCVLTRGVVRQYNLAAAVANGHEGPHGEGAPGAGAESVDDASGVPVSELAGAIDQAGLALRDCRAQVTGWQTYYATVARPWIASAVESLQQCVPKESP
jgi:hypothetical protein